MSTNLLPQALYMVPRNPILQFGQKKQAFSCFVAKPSSPSGLCISRIESNAFSFKKLKKQNSFFVRAEENDAEAEPVAEVEVTEVVDEVEAAQEGEGQVVEKAPRKERIKLGDIMGILNKKAVEASDEIRKTPDIRVGDVVQIKLEVPENKRRLSVYKGIVMSKQNAGIHTTIRIRRIIAGIGVEIVFPVYSPNIKELQVLSHRKVRRARLYYLRDKLPRLSTFK
ncbi:hypothetical protein Leryth_000762 [Lithospermum erythrorhizon]|nr:hypothetical protein Leryth_000762 [Lithospermum erythrorhizon]